MFDLPIKITADKEIAGNHPVVIIGPNGSGKTTFGANLARTNNAEWIGATRNLQFSDSISMQTPEQATNEVSNITNQQRNSPWMLSNELNQLLAKLKAEDSESAVKFRNESIITTGGKPEKTKIIQLVNIWNSIFPKREIDFSSYSPKVKAGHVNDTPFGISKMSGGERVALYLLARVLDAPSGLIFIDEPEIHFHSVLAKKFWNELEIIRNDCRFIYITHDIPFAVSRNNVQFIIVYSASEQTILKQEHSLPDDIIESVLGAATFSVSAKRIVFCEGSKNNKRDDEVYSAWFDSENTAVISVGSCDEVIKCVEVFNQTQAVRGVQSIGIIDRDFHSDDYFSSLSTDIKVLPLHEIESLFCLKDLFVIIGIHLGKQLAEITSLYNQFINEITDAFNNNLIEKNKIILERVKKRTKWQSKNLLNAVNNPSKTLAEIKLDYLDALKIENWLFVPSDFFEEEKNRVQGILDSKNIEELLKIFPGKTIFGKIIGKLGITQDSLINIIISALNNPASTIRDGIILIFKDYLPEQSMSNAQSEQNIPAETVSQ